MFNWLFGTDSHRAKLGSEWAEKNEVGDVVTYWRHRGGGPFGEGEIWCWGWQMQASREWEQVTAAEYHRQFAKKAE